MITDANFQLDSIAKFSFEKFICSTGCRIDYYLISGSNSNAEIPPISQGVSGLGAITDETFAVDTSVVGTIYSFYIFSRLKFTESVYTFSNQVTISIECGSETISLLSAAYSHGVLRPYADPLLFVGFLGNFLSTKS